MQSKYRKSPASNTLPYTQFHPRNRHQGRYDFTALMMSSPALADFVQPNAHGDNSLDFANPAAVKALNNALLQHHYGIQNWDIPAHSLCPPVPGRADYIHHLADLLATCNQGVIPKNGAIQALDIGTGASCIYPLIGHGEYGWHFIASDINPASLSTAQAILDTNPVLAQHITLRLQAQADGIFRGILKADEWLDVTLCNPPFHASKAEASAGTTRKWQNLGKASEAAPRLNFGGEDTELWCAGGESGFIQRMITESMLIASRCYWFTTLVSKSASLPGIYAALQQAGVVEHKTITMRQGQKQSRLVAWTFLNPVQQAAWRKLRWSRP